MKKSYLVLIACSVSMALFTACGGGSGTSNEYLSDIPSLEKNYYGKMQEKEQALKECTDMEKAFELAKEKDLLKEEWDTKIKESFTTKPLTKALPFEGLDTKDFTINEIKVESATKGHMGLKFYITINEDMKDEYGNLKKDVIIYFKALDKDGKEIEESTTVAVVFNREEMKAGKNIEASATWQSKAIQNMENFAKIQIINKEEYDTKK